MCRGPLCLFCSKHTPCAVAFCDNANFNFSLTRRAKVLKSAIWTDVTWPSVPNERHAERAYYVETRLRQHSINRPQPLTLVRMVAGTLRVPSAVSQRPCLSTFFIQNIGGLIGTKRRHAERACYFVEKTWYGFHRWPYPLCADSELD